MTLKKKKEKKKKEAFLSIFYIFFIYFNRVSVNRWNGRRYQHVLALYALLTGVILKELVLRKYVFHVCVCMLSFVCTGTGFVD